MLDSPHKIQWHPAFYAAAGLELQANHQELQMIPEYNLSKEPISIDLLIIKNEGQAKKIENEIGHIMKKYNVIEYKSPEDSNNIDAVLQVSVTANYDLYQEVRRESIMCQALQELMKDDIEEKIDGVHIEDIKNIMKAFNVSAEQAMDVLQIPQNRRAFILSNL